MASTIRIDEVNDPLTVMDKEVYDPTGRGEDIFAAVDLKMDAADPVFTGVMTAPAGTAAAPSIHGSQADAGLHFPANKVGIAAEGLNAFRIGKSDTTITNDTLVVVARTTGSSGHGYPNIVLRNGDQTTPDGAGPFFGFQSYNDAGVLRDAIQTNGGLQDATAGAEGSAYDIAGYRAGASEVLFSVNGAEAMVGPGVDNVMDLGRASYRLNNGFVRQLRPGAGGVIWTSGSGSPEGVVTAPIGSLFTRTDGSTSTTLYVKTSGSGNTGWTAK